MLHGSYFKTNIQPNPLSHIPIHPLNLPPSAGDAMWGPLFRYTSLLTYCNNPGPGFMGVPQAIALHKLGWLGICIKGQPGSNSM
jgi:hypothetical protein